MRHSHFFYSNSILYQITINQILLYGTSIKIPVCIEPKKSYYQEELQEHNMKEN